MVRRVDANDALLRELERLGATAADIEAPSPGELTGLGARLTLLGPGRRLSFAEAAGLLAVTEDEMRDRWRAAGMPEPTGPGGGFREADLVIFSTTELAEAAFGEAGTQQLSRVVSESVARVARAAGSIFRSGVGNEALAADPSGVELLRRNDALVNGLLPGLMTVMERLLRHHLAADLRPTAEVVAQAGSRRGTSPSASPTSSAPRCWPTSSRSPTPPTCSSRSSRSRTTRSAGTA